MSQWLKIEVDMQGEVLNGIFAYKMVLKEIYAYCNFNSSLIFCIYQIINAMYNSSCNCYDFED